MHALLALPIALAIGLLAGTAQANCGPTKPSEIVDAFDASQTILQGKVLREVATPPTGAGRTARRLYLVEVQKVWRGEPRRLMVIAAPPAGNAKQPCLTRLATGTEVVIGGQPQVLMAGALAGVGGATHASTMQIWVQPNVVEGARRLMNLKYGRPKIPD
jgi:hypothetical protein